MTARRFDELSGSHRQSQVSSCFQSNVKSGSCELIVKFSREESSGANYVKVSSVKLGHRVRFVCDVDFVSKSFVWIR